MVAERVKSAVRTVCAMSLAAGHDENSPLNSLNNPARLGDVLNQTGLLRHWLDRYPKSSCVENVASSGAVRRAPPGRQVSYSD